MSDAPFLPPERVGFVGLGNMGAPMARRLIGAGYKLVVADALAATVDKFVAEPANASSSERSAGAQALARACRVVITMLPDGKIVREVLLGADGIARAARRPGEARDSACRCAGLGRREESHRWLARPHGGR